MSSITDLRRVQERRMEAIRLFEAMERDDAAFLAELVASSRGHQGGTNGSAHRVAAKAAPASPSEAFEAIRGLITARGNQWTETSMIRDSTGLSKSVVAYALKANAALLESRPHPSHGRKIEFRMKTQTQ